MTNVTSRLQKKKCHYASGVRTWVARVPFDRRRRGHLLPFMLRPNLFAPQSSKFIAPSNRPFPPCVLTDRPRPALTNVLMDAQFKVASRLERSRMERAYNCWYCRKCVPVSTSSAWVKVFNVTKLETNSSGPIPSTVKTSSYTALLSPMSWAEEYVYEPGKYKLYVEKTNYRPRAWRDRFSPVEQVL
jgi:hypothetical protein